MMMGAVPGVDAAATVFHGSPHKFDRFDSSKIGTGEGAQAYGHGLYLADSPAVAGGYKDRLSIDYVKPDGGLEHYGDAWNKAFDAASNPGAGDVRRRGRSAAGNSGKDAPPEARESLPVIRGRELHAS
jgi:hypothetical protein